MKNIMRFPTPIDYHNANLASKDRAKVCSYRNTAILKHGGGFLTTQRLKIMTRLVSSTLKKGRMQHVVDGPLWLWNRKRTQEGCVQTTILAMVHTQTACDDPVSLWSA